MYAINTTMFTVLLIFDEQDPALSLRLMDQIQKYFRETDRGQQRAELPAHLGGERRTHGQHRQLDLRRHREALALIPGSGPVEASRASRACRGMRILRPMRIAPSSPRATAW